MSSLKKTFHHKGHEVHKGILLGEIQDHEIQRKINSLNSVSLAPFVVRKGFCSGVIHKYPGNKRPDRLKCLDATRQVLMALKTQLHRGFQHRPEAARQLLQHADRHFGVAIQQAIEIPAQDRHAMGRFGSADRSSALAFI